MNPNQDIKVSSLAVAILAAGASKRMGRPKMLLPWGGTTVIGHIVSIWRALEVGQIAVVCAKSDQLLEVELDRLQVPRRDRIFNANPADGMFSSIRCAGAWPGWQPDLTHWLIALGDQPHLRIETVRALLDFAREHPRSICQPAHAGRPRHPVLLPRSQWELLRDAPVDNLKSFLQSLGGQVRLCAIDDPGLDLDLDYPMDYERALAAGKNQNSR